ncbi:MAG: hypothetical protein KF777_13605 [Planctomycetaceae bacterium]|nr:hypothetical protein [Planctomycetaceae bacterium]
MSTRRMIGIANRLYYNTGTVDVPIWVAIPIAKDIKVTGDKEKVEITNRGHGEVNRYGGGGRDIGFTFDVSNKPADATFLALQASYTGNTSIELAATDGDITVAGTHGVRAVCEVFKFEKTAGLKGEAKWDVEAAPTDSTAVPSYFTVAD